MALIANGTEGGKLAKEICDAFGLKHVTDLKIHMVANGVFTLEAKMYMEKDGAKKLPAILKKFELVPIVDLDNTTTLGQNIETFDFKVSG